MNTIIARVTLVGLACSLLVLFTVWPQSSHAHGRWLLSSHHQLSGEAQYVVVDFSISNQIFYPDYSYGGIEVADQINKKDEQKEQRKEKESKSNALKSSQDKIIAELMASTKLVALSPDGKNRTEIPFVDQKRRSSGAVKIEHDGTYRLAVEQSPINFTWFKDSKGDKHRLFGRLDQLANVIPDDAKDVFSTRLINQLHSYVSLNGNSQKVIKPSGQGLELKFSGHPNDLFVGETMQFQVLFDGKVLRDIDHIHLTPAQTRYRNQRGEKNLDLDKQGYVNIAWAEAGQYLLVIEYKRDINKASLKSETHALYLSLEVNPE